MNASEREAILTIALLAAFADGAKDDRERGEIKRIAESLAGEPGAPPLSQLYQNVLLERVNASQAAAVLTDPNHKQLAYEMAVCVCDADGVANEAEVKFLNELRTLLRLDSQRALQVEKDAAALAEVPLPEKSSAAQSKPQTAQPIGGAIRQASMSDAEMDRYILNHAIVNGAIELLPQSLATMAIIPLQIKLVYRIGQAYGFELDKGHIREFLATVGVGLTSQYVEQFGRKLLGGLLGSVAGSLGRRVGRVGAGAAFSFATTYALGQLARRYYAGGRQMGTALLREMYQSLLGEARQLQARHSLEIEHKAATLDATQVMSLVRNA
jgi:uncharacterized protein (DUF697 family)/tellurite resistance protein